MKNISSTNIKVFPSVGRADGYDLTAHLMTEKNITQLIRNLYSRKSFVISDNEETIKAGNFEFIIGGYYFNLENVVLEEAEKLNLYAGIKLLDETKDPTNLQPVKYQYLVVSPNNEVTELDPIRPLDNESGTFIGLDLSSTPLESEKYSFTLQLLNEGLIPSKSKLHWNTEEILDGDSDKSINDSLTVNKITGVSKNIELVGKVEDRNFSLTIEDIKNN